MIKRLLYEIRCSLVVELCHLVLWVCPKRGEFCYVVAQSMRIMMAGIKEAERRRTQPSDAANS